MLHLLLGKDPDSMRIPVFFQYLTALSLAWGLVLFAWLYFTAGAWVYVPFAAATLSLFVLICLLLFFFGWRAARSSQRMAFNGVITSSVFGKMVVSLAFLAIYKKTYAPAGTSFVVIFLLTYAVYTLFEIWFMTRLAKT